MENTYDPLKSYLTSTGQQFSQANLQSLAQSKGIQGYTGTDTQNKQLAGLLTPSTTNTPLVPTLPTSTNVNANSLIQSTPVTLPNTPASSLPTVPISTADRILNQMGIDEQTNTQVAQQNIIGKKLEALAGLTGESAALAAEQEKAGVARLKGELQNINSQILTKQAEIQQDDIQLISKMRAEERRDTLLPFAQMGQAKIQGDAAIYRALKTSEIGVLNATAIAKQGDIQLAKETAQEAVDVKYAPYKEQIKQYDAILEAISPLLTRDEKIQAQKQQIRGQVAMKEIDKETANEKQLNDMLIQASSQNAPANLVAQAKLAKTPSEAAMILGQYAGDYYKTELLKNQIATEKAQKAKIYNDISNSNKNLSMDNNGQPITDINQFDPLKFKDATARTSFTTLKGVLNAVNDLKKNAPDGDFAGLGFLGGSTRDYITSAEGIKNRAYLNAINLKVQQWASGASLTAQQIEQVNKLVPSETETDRVIKEKLDALEGYMNNEASSIAASQGQSYQPPITGDIATDNYLHTINSAYQNIGTQQLSGDAYAKSLYGGN